MDTMKEAVARKKRMDAIAESHDLQTCENDHCELCEEYYNLLQKMYEDMGQRRNYNVTDWNENS